MTGFTYLYGAQIQEVLDLDSGNIYPASKVVGNDDEKAIALRTEIKERLFSDDPKFACPLCWVPIYLCANPQKTGQFFRHKHEDGNCPAITRGELNQNEARAIKYNGAKESNAHKKMKMLLEESLKSDSNFSEIHIEKIVKSNATTIGERKKWRKPDIRALYDHSINFVFEVQLSTTFIDEIVQRKQFYLKQGDFLFWIFKDFNLEDAKLTHLDIFIPNGHNAFVVDEETRDISVKNNKLHFKCFWNELSIQNETIVNNIKYKVISVPDSLVLYKDKQQAFYYDYEKARYNVNLELLKIKIYNACNKYITDQSEWESLQIDCSKYKLYLPKNNLLLKAIYSLKENRIIGTGFNKLIEYAHKIYEYNNGWALFFAAASNAYSRKNILDSQDKNRKWEKKKLKMWSDLNKIKGSVFLPDGTIYRAIMFLFPEVITELRNIMNQIKHSN